MKRKFYMFCLFLLFSIFLLVGCSKKNDNSDDLKQVTDVSSVVDNGDTSSSGDLASDSSRDDDAISISDQDIKYSEDNDDSVLEDEGPVFEYLDEDTDILNYIKPHIKGYSTGNSAPFWIDIVGSSDDYGAESSWREKDDYFEVDVIIKAPTVYIEAGDKFGISDGSDELTDSTVMAFGHEIKLGKPEKIHVFNPVVGCHPALDDKNKVAVIPVISIDGDSCDDDETVFLYGPMLNAGFSNVNYDSIAYADEDIWATEPYYWMLCYAWYQDYGSTFLEHHDDAWFPYVLDLGDKEVRTIRVKKDAAVILSVDGWNDHSLEFTMENIFTKGNKDVDHPLWTSYDFAKDKVDDDTWSWYEWFAPNEYGWKSMARAQVIFDPAGYVEELIPYGTGD